MAAVDERLQVRVALLLARFARQQDASARMRASNCAGVISARLMAGCDPCSLRSA